MDIALQAALVMAGTITVLLFLGVPISICIGASSALAMLMILPLNSALQTSATQIFSGANKFNLMAIPFFILAGNIMNNGGISHRLVSCAKVLSGRLPGALAQTNVVGNMLFGAISGSGAAAAAAIGGTMYPMQKEEGYDPDYCCAVNAASGPTGMLIPPSNAMIVFAMVAGNISVAALFMAGYIPGILWGLSVMMVAAVMAVKRGYRGTGSVPISVILRVFWDAIPSLFLIVIVIGGIIKGVFTATEGSAIAVAYALILCMLYRSLSIKALPDIILQSFKMTSIIVFMAAMSSIMSWVLSFTGTPEMVANAMLSLSQEKIVILLMMNVILLLVGTFMDPTPAILIFTPIFLPIALDMGVHPVHFGIILVFNLSIGTITPPVGVILFTACKVANVTIESVFKTILPYFAAIFVVLMLVTYIPQLSLWLPSLAGLIK